MKKNILIIEDSHSQRAMFRSELAIAGYNVTTSENGTQGLENASSNKPDLILLDIMLPDIDGFKVCTSLKTSNETNDIPVIMISDLSKSSFIVKGTLCGAASYQLKSTPFEIILKEIQKLIGE